VLSGKNIVLGVTGGIAVYKSVDLVSRLRKLNANVYVVMTEHAKAFVTPLTFQSMSQNYVVHDMFEAPKTWDVEHIALAKKADLFVVAPATANVIAKVCHGIADDFLTTTLMATPAQVVFAPAMNTNMYENPITQNNISTLKSLGYEFIEPGTGRLACGDLGAGKMAEPVDILNYIVKFFEPKSQPMKGVKVLISAGPTIERIDPIRYITNRSTGKMGYAIAKKALEQGAQVTLVSGPTQLAPPEGVEFISVESAVEMYDVFMARMQEQDIIIKTAAVADYRPLEVAKEKIKKSEGEMELKFTRNPDILKTLGERKTHQVLVGFAAETTDVLTYAKRKIEQKHLDFIVANDVSQEGAGFAADTNIVTLIDSEGNVSPYNQQSKEAVAEIVLEKAMGYYHKVKAKE
jgi:phosphopantothenoylcysteine decarboxylase/phosphopantothenate--cysteine ligase